MLRRHVVLLIAGLVLLTSAGILGGCAGLLEAREADEAPDVRPDPPSDDAEVILYFSDWQAQYAMPELRRAQRVGDESLAMVVVRELIAGPEDPHLVRTLPEDVEIISLEIVDDIAYVNFSEEVQNVYGSASEVMTIRSLVYSLTELADIDRVQILIEGAEADTLGGHMALDEPLGRGRIVTHPVFVDADRAEWLQERADAGEDTFRRDPLEVARFDGRMAGFAPGDDFTLVDVDEEDGEAVVMVSRDGEEYRVELVQPATTGENGIWMISAIEMR